MPPVDPPTTLAVGWLLIAIGALAGACSTVFYLLLASKKETLDLAREVLPLVTVLSKLVERLELKERGP